jgi:hypothetical protein
VASFVQRICGVGFVVLAGCAVGAEAGDEQTSSKSDPLTFAPIVVPRIPVPTCGPALPMSGRAQSFVASWWVMIPGNVACPDILVGDDTSVISVSVGTFDGYATTCGYDSLNARDATHFDEFEDCPIAQTRGAIAWWESALPTDGGHHGNSPCGAACGK